MIFSLRFEHLQGLHTFRAEISLSLADGAEGPIAARLLFIGADLLEKRVKRFHCLHHPHG
jgi:hypothetical protein